MLSPQLMPSAPARRAIDALQERVQRDEGNRGIKPLTRPGQLLLAAQTLLAAPVGGSVLLLTGFPCLRDRTPPCESDGPPGVAALACTLLALGRPVTLPIEEHSADVLRRTCAGGSSCCSNQVPEVVAFPTASTWAAADDARLAALRDAARCVVSLERAGDAATAPATRCEHCRWARR